MYDQISQLLSAKAVLIWSQSCSYLAPKMLVKFTPWRPKASAQFLTVTLIATFSSLYRRECRRGGGTRSVDVLAKRPCPGVYMIKLSFFVTDEHAK